MLLIIWPTWSSKVGQYDENIDDELVVHVEEGEDDGEYNEGDEVSFDGDDADEASDDGD